MNDFGLQVNSRAAPFSAKKKEVNNSTCQYSINRYTHELTTMNRVLLCGSHNRRLLMDHLDLPYDGESTTTAVADPNQPQSSSQAAGVSSASSKDAAPGDQLPQVVDASDTNAKPTNSGALPQEASTANACPSFNAGDKVTSFFSSK